MVLVVILGIFVASHTVTSLAVLTGAAVQAITSVPTAFSSRQREITRLTADLEAERVRHKQLKSQLDVAQTRAARLDTDLSRERGRTAELEERLRTPTRASLEARGRAKALMESVSSRTKSAAATNTAAMVGEAIPFYGIGVIVAATGYELHVACSNMKDMAELAALFDDQNSQETLSEDKAVVCGTQVPTKEEVWAAVKASPGSAWEKSASALGNSRDWAVSLEAPDFSALWRRGMSLFDW